MFNKVFALTIAAIVAIAAFGHTEAHAGGRHGGLLFSKHHGPFAGHHNTKNNYCTRKCRAKQARKRAAAKKRRLAAAKRAKAKRLQAAAARKQAEAKAAEAIVSKQDTPNVSSAAALDTPLRDIDAKTEDTADEPTIVSELTCKRFIAAAGMTINVPCGN